MLARTITPIALALLLSSPALADDVFFEVNFERPAGAVTLASGTISVVFDNDTLAAAWQITYGGLSGPPTAISLVTGEGDATEVLSIIGNLASPVVGGATLDLTQAALLLAGEIAVVIKSAALPTGELRAELVPTGMERGGGAE